MKAALRNYQLKIILIEDLEGLLVQLVDERLACRDFDRDDLLRSEVLEHHDDGTQRVAMSSDENLLPSVDLRGNGLVPIRLDALGGVNQALGKRAIGLGHFASSDELLVGLLIARPSLVVLGKG